MSDRSKIIDKLVEKFKEIDGTGPYKSNLFNNVSNRLKFWDEVPDYPFVCMTAGQEFRTYEPGNVIWGTLTIPVKVYVHGEDPESLLEDVIGDLEYVLDNNFDQLYYDDARPSKTTQDIRVSSIYTDEGVLAPHGVGEITLEVLYEKTD